jgi:hypothetical protein
VTTLAGFAGSGAALIVIGLCWVVMRHYRHLPSGAHPWICRALIVLMLLAGSALVVTPLGSGAIHLITVIGGWFGGLGTGTLHAAIVIAALILAAATIASLIWMPQDGAALNAIFVPLVLALPASGALHTLYVLLGDNARTAVVQIAAWLGG